MFAGTWICSLCTDEMESKGKLEDQNKHSDKKGAIKTDSDGSHEEDEETSKYELFPFTHRLSFVRQ